MPTVGAHEYSAAAAPSLSKSLAEEFNGANVNRRQCGREALGSVYSDLQQLSRFTHSRVQSRTNERISLPPASQETGLCFFPTFIKFLIAPPDLPSVFSLYVGIIHLLYWV